MIITPELLHYIAAGVTILLGAIGAGIGIGNAGQGVEESMIRQPAAQMPTFRAMIIGLALIESGAIVALVSTLLILFNRPVLLTWPIVWAEFGAAVAVGCASAAVCIASSFVVRTSAQSIARQPLFAPKIMTFTLITQSIIEAPVIFAFIVALLLRTRFDVTIEWWAGIKLFSAGVVVALGAIGSSIGQALFATSATQAMGLNPRLYNRLFPFALLNQALIETPMIFCLLFSLMILWIPLVPATMAIVTVRCLVAAGTISIGALVGSIGIGYVASHSSVYIALEPTVYAAMARTTLLAVAFIESTVIYALIIATVLIR